MSDEKNNSDTDFEEKLAKIVNKKSRHPTNNNIYERFISRVKNDEDDRSADLGFTDTIFDFSDQSKSIPSQNNPTLPENSDLDGDDNDDAFNFNFDDEINPSSQAAEPALSVRSDIDETVHELDNDRLHSQILPIQAPTKKVDSSKDKQASSKKPLIIGMMLGSLLIGIVVAILIFTGILSPSMKEDAPNAVEASTVNQVETDAATDSEAVVIDAEAPTTVDNPLSADTNPVNAPTAALPQSSSTDDAQAATANEPAPAATDALDTEPAISYEDFREESQNTLYRETND